MGKRVTGIGGVFFKCNDPEATKAWYKNHLGLQTDAYGTNFEWRNSEDPSKKGFTQWSPFSDASPFFASTSQSFMMNYRVENLEWLVQELKKEGVKVLDDIETFDYGKFVHIMDPNGLKIQLWEPNDVIYETYVDGRTK